MKVDVTLNHSDGAYRGKVVETRFGKEEDTFDVAFPCTAAPDFEVGQEAVFFVSSETLMEDLELSGVVRDARIEAEEFRLLVACSVDCATPSNARSDRRGAARVRPDEGTILASISQWDGPWTCEPLLNDVSATGLSFLVPTGFDELEDGELLALGLYFDPEGAMDLVGRVRWHRRTGPYDLYGVEFDESLTEDLSRKQLLMHFFVERRREALARGGSTEEYD